MLFPGNDVNEVEIGGFHYRYLKRLYGAGESRNVTFKCLKWPCLEKPQWEGELTAKSIQKLSGCTLNSVGMVLKRLGEGKYSVFYEKPRYVPFNYRNWGNTDTKDVRLASKFLVGR